MLRLYWIVTLLYTAKVAHSQSGFSDAVPSSAFTSQLRTSLASSTAISVTAVSSGFSTVTPSKSITSSGFATATPSNTIASITATATITAAPTPTVTSSSSPSGIPIGIPRDYSPAGLAKLWDLVGPVEVPPITTTVIPQTPIALPSHPPALYPSFLAVAPKDILPDLKYPEGFLFGVASAAYQVEGAVMEEGKGPSVWDWASRQPGAVTDNTTADVVDLHYFLYKEDVARIAALGVNSHSFSVSWARIFPFGAADSPVNQQGLDHYADGNSFTIIVHWDTPLALAAYYGGFTSPKFTLVIRTLLSLTKLKLGDRYTFNEPQVYCAQVGSFPFNLSFAPGINEQNAQFQCSYNLLKAHAGAVKAFREMGITGEIAFKSADYIGMPWRANNTEDMEAVERNAAFNIGVFADPILKDTLPPDVLPRLTEQESKEILDAYRTYWNAAPPEGIDACVNNTSDPLWPGCFLELMNDFNTGWSSGPASDPLTPWLQATPQFLRPSFKRLHERWPTSKIYLSEFGFTQPFEGVRNPQVLFQLTEDPERTNYYMTYLGELLLSIHEDGIPVQGAFCWAIMDNAEWNSGLSARFGIQYVNYSSPTLERSYKRSAFALGEFTDVLNPTYHTDYSVADFFEAHL
ncbi:glycoside hydrolase superfamily [Rhodocollybia butyracea]|uniref:Glycoside hydrolase superfamily n=1 Tax=Rhodocollybia butyracea TaxID=206335 RepID=A0A9P5PR03_9AGAR|nr:glycoside hydrolase superfamily [Rhodocollybia butyracea]